VLEAQLVNAMSVATQSELSEFHQFMGTRLKSPGPNLTPEEILEEWRLLRGDIAGSKRDRLAVQAALLDMQQGDPGVDFDVHLRELKQRFKP